MQDNNIMPNLITYHAGHIVDTSKWRRLNARLFGINHKHIPPAAWTVLTILRNEGNLIFSLFCFFSKLYSASIAKVVNGFVFEVNGYMGKQLCHFFFT